MNDTEIQPKTAALRAFIESGVSKLVNSPASDTSDGLLYLGNWVDTTPRVLLYDEELEPLDIVVYMLIKTHTTPNAPTAFPSYAKLIKRCQCSRTSLARSIAILRLTRWITLCANVRQSNDQFRGNVYALHDEPLPLPDTLYLDSRYMQFLTDTVAETLDARLQTVSHAVLQSISDSVADNANILEGPMYSYSERLSARIDITQRESMTTAIEFENHSFFATNYRDRRRVQILDSGNSGAELNSFDKTNARVQNLDSGGSDICSSSIKKTTTTKSESKEKNHGSLLIPVELTDNERNLVPLYLKKSHRETAYQDILDELGGRIRFGNTKIPNRLGYLNRLVEVSKDPNAIVLTSCGLKYREEREKRQVPQTTKKPDAQTREVAIAAIQAMKHMGKVNL